MDLLLLFLPLFNLAESPLKRNETNQFDHVSWKRDERVLSTKPSPRLYVHNEEAWLKRVTIWVHLHCTPFSASWEKYTPIKPLQHSFALAKNYDKIADIFWCLPNREICRVPRLAYNLKKLQNKLRNTLWEGSMFLLLRWVYFRIAVNFIFCLVDHLATNG